MQCPKCHNECIDTQKFCTKCGNPLNFSTVSAPDEIPTQKQWESLGGGWNNAKNTNVAESVTVLRYPFFKDAEEQTVAVLGEKAIAADLEGKYSVPYAVLTQRYLYCKNETGNYVTEVADIEAVKDNWSPPGIGKFIMAMFLPRDRRKFCVKANSRHPFRQECEQKPQTDGKDVSIWKRPRMNC